MFETFFNLTSYADVADDLAQFQLHQLEHNPLWSSVYAELAPPKCPASAAVSVHLSPPAAVALQSAAAPVSDDSDVVATSQNSALVYTTSAAAAASHESNAVSLKTTKLVYTTTAAAAVSSFLSVDAAVPLQFATKPRRTARMTCIKSVDTSDISSDDSDGFLSRRTRSTRHQKPLHDEDSDGVLSRRTRTRKEIAPASRTAGTRALGTTATSTGAAAAAPSPTEITPGLLINGSNPQQVKGNVLLLFAMSGHQVRVVNSRAGYLYFKCKSCVAGCGVSTNVHGSSSWHVTTCNDTAKLPCLSSLCVPKDSAGGVHHLNASADVRQLDERSTTFVTCSVCEDDTVKKDRSVQCDKQHTLCSDCFDNWVNSQFVNDDKRLRFIANGGEVRCFVCENQKTKSEFVFDMHSIACMVTADVYSKYVQCSTEIAVAQARQAVEKRLSEAQDEIERLKAADPEQVEIGTCLLYNFSMTLNHSQCHSSPCS